MVRVAVADALEPILWAGMESAVRDCLAEVRAAHDDWARLVTEVLDQFETLIRQQLETRLQAEHRRAEEVAAAAQRAASAVENTLAAQLRHLQEELAVAIRERAALEAELEAVRNRAAELSETLEAERRQSAEQRAAWTSELQRLRHLLETWVWKQQADEDPTPATVPLVHPGAGRPTTLASAPEMPGSPPSQEKTDPVLDSVMAQFDLLQRDAARRRKTAANSA